MDKSYCSNLVVNKTFDVLKSPINYVLKEIHSYIKMAFSVNCAHCVPTLVFLVGMWILLKILVQDIFDLPNNSPIKKNIINRILYYIVKTCAFVICYTFVSFSWVLLQDFIYCYVWFSTFQSLNPDLLEKWWFKGNKNYYKSESMKSFAEIIPPEIFSWIITTIIASYVFYVAVNKSENKYSRKKRGFAMFFSSIYKARNHETVNPIPNDVNNRNANDEIGIRQTPEVSRNLQTNHETEADESSAE